MTVHLAQPQDAPFVVGSSFLLDDLPLTWYPTMSFGPGYAPAEALALWEELTSIEGILETQEIWRHSESHNIVVRCVVCGISVSVTLVPNTIGVCALEFHQVLYSYLRGKTDADQQPTMLSNRRNRHPPIHHPRGAWGSGGDWMEYRCAE